MKHWVSRDYWTNDNQNIQYCSLRYQGSRTQHVEKSIQGHLLYRCYSSEIE
uniref:Uncharacterized protein n=1 Tax=Pristionchus pacificus TaxID=54126 RepID=A0A8R1V393_PRIPA